MQGRGVWGEKGVLKSRGEGGRMEYEKELGKAEGGKKGV